MATAPTRRLVVCGGSGFLGAPPALSPLFSANASPFLLSQPACITQLTYVYTGHRICQVAAGRSWKVTSLSRTGEPSWPTLGLSHTPAWASSVEWARGDIMDPASYRGMLKGADAVVHTMGILIEADYKGVLQGKEPFLGGLKRAFDSARGTGENTVRAGHGALSYETMNRDTGTCFHRPKQ